MSQHRVWVFGDHINTDLIFAGKYTYTLKTPEDLASKALEDLDPSFASHVQQGDVIIAGRNWGCGSSREQAVTALKYAGIVAIIAVSFNGLYYRNCINQGVYPILCDGLQSNIQTGDTISLDIDKGIIMANETEYTFPAFAPNVRAILEAGGLMPMLRQRFQQTGVK